MVCTAGRSCGGGELDPPAQLTGFGKLLELVGIVERKRVRFLLRVLDEQQFCDSIVDIGQKWYVLNENFLVGFVDGFIDRTDLYHVDSMRRDKAPVGCSSACG